MLRGLGRLQPLGLHHALNEASQPLRLSISTVEPKTHKCIPNRKDVELLATLETASITLCGIAMLLWMSIGTFTRAGVGEAFAQRTILSCV